MKNRIMISVFATALFASLIFSCKKEQAQPEKYSSEPILPEQPYDYEQTENNHLAALGRVLFYDKALSLNNSISCGSCHQQSKAFCDNVRFSTGLTDLKTARNAPSIFAREGRVFWDGRAEDLGDLALRPIKNHVEMRFENMQTLVSKLEAIEYYPDLFENAFGAGAKIDTAKIKQALFEFLMNFNFSNNRFQESRSGGAPLNASERLGEEVFFNKGQCSNCHNITSDPGGNNGYGFTNESFNIGLEETYADNGLGAVQNEPGLNGHFMVPVLLNVEFTAPYMHDGRFNTLEEVVEHYNSGVKAHPNLSFELQDLSKFENMTMEELLKEFDRNHNGMFDEEEIPVGKPLRLGLTNAEKQGLVNFLKTLGDPAIFSDVRFNNPFVK